MTSQRLLIVDDDKHVLDILGRFFVSYGYKVDTAETCVDALRLCRLYHPDCLLLDFHLRDGKGDRVCREVRTDVQLKNTPIIMLSVDPAKELNSYTEYEADSFILKGASLDKVRAVVESVLRRVYWERRVIEFYDVKLTGYDCCVYRNSRLVTKLSSDQFSMVYLLVANAGKFIADDILAETIMRDNPMVALDRMDSIRSMVYRVRKNLGPQLARRIKNRKNKGWIYVQPRQRVANAPASCETVANLLS